MKDNWKLKFVCQRNGWMSFWFGIRSTTKTRSQSMWARALSGDPILHSTMREYPINWREYFLTSYRNWSDISYGIGSCHETSCLVESTGNISCIEPCSYVAHCKTDYTLWPYDKQNCSMMFGPWMSSDAIDYVGDSAVISYGGAAQHTQWKLVSAVVSKKVLNSTKMPNLFYVFTIERHSALITKVIGRRFILWGLYGNFVTKYFWEISWNSFDRWSFKWKFENLKVVWHHFRTVPQHR